MLTIDSSWLTRCATLSCSRCRIALNCMLKICSIFKSNLIVLLINSRTFSSDDLYFSTSRSIKSCRFLSCSVSLTLWSERPLSSEVTSLFSEDSSARFSSADWSSRIYTKNINRKLFQIYSFFWFFENINVFFLLLSRTRTWPYKNIINENFAIIYSRDDGPETSSRTISGSLNIYRSSFTIFKCWLEIITENWIYFKLESLFRSPVFLDF